MCKGALPLDRAGTIALPKLPERKYVKNYYENKSITEDILVDHFNNMFVNLVDGLVKKDYDSIQKIVEKRFFEKLSQNKEQIGKFKLEFDENQVDGNDSYIID